MMSRRSGSGRRPTVVSSRKRQSSSHLIATLILVITVVCRLMNAFNPPMLADKKRIRTGLYLSDFHWGVRVSTGYD